MSLSLLIRVSPVGEYAHSQPPSLSLTRLSASPQVSPMSFNSASTLLLHVIFGISLFLFPGGFHLRNFLALHDVSILSTCPTHFNRLVCISLSIFWHPVFLYRSLLEILFGQRIFAILRRQVLWKEFNTAISVLTTLQHSDPYSRTDFILLLYGLILVFKEYCFDFQMFVRLMKAFLSRCEFLDLL